jgi:hypothetical protein
VGVFQAFHAIAARRVTIWCLFVALGVDDTLHAPTLAASARELAILTVCGSQAFDTDPGGGVANTPFGPAAVVVGLATTDTGVRFEVTRLAGRVAVRCLDTTHTFAFKADRTTAVAIPRICTLHATVCPLVALSLLAVSIVGALHALAVVAVAVWQVCRTIAIVIAGSALFGARVLASIAEQVDAAVLFGVAGCDSASRQCGHQPGNHERRSPEPTPGRQLLFAQHGDYSRTGCLPFSTCSTARRASSSAKPLGLSRR